MSQDVWIEDVWRCLKYDQHATSDGLPSGVVWHSFCGFETQAVHTEVLGVSKKYSTGLGVPLPRGCFGIWVFRAQGVSSNHPKAPAVQLSLVLKPVCWDGLGYFRVPPMCKIQWNTKICCHSPAMRCVWVGFRGTADSSPGVVCAAGSCWNWMFFFVSWRKMKMHYECASILEKNMKQTLRNI